MLLLLRAGKHNTGRWGLPGGNAEDSDGSLLATAKREAAEELGGASALPPYTVVGDGILTKWVWRRECGGVRGTVCRCMQQRSWGYQRAAALRYFG